MAQPIKTGARTFDDAKLQSMVEPLTVRVERLKGGTTSPVPLPEPEDGSAPGTNYDKDTVRKLENWLVTEWSGGGMYEITVTDSQGSVMKWRPYWNPQEYPELIPEPLAKARAEGVVPFPVSQQVSINQQQGRQMPSFPHGLPSNPGYPQQPQYSYYPPMPPAPNPGTPAWAAYQAEAERRAKDEELIRMREERAKAEREALAQRHAAELNAERQANEQRFGRQDQALTNLQNMIAGLAQAIKESATAARPNPETEQLRLQMAQVERERERERERADNERRDREMRDLIKTMNDNMQRQIDVLVKQLADSSRDRIDPMMALFKEQAREQGEAIKEVSRNFAAQISQLQTMIMRPMDVLQMAKESSSSAEGAVSKIQQLMGGIIDMQRQSFESIMQMQPQGAGAIDVVRDGVQGLKDLAERYVGMRQVEAHSQVQIASAQANAWAETQRAQIIAQGGGLAGAPQTQPQPVAKSPVVPDAVIGEGKNKRGSSKKRLGKTDTEWFGPIAGNVDELRTGVNEFMISLKSEPFRLDKDGKPVGVSPEQTVFAVLQATQQLMQMNMPIPALVDLLFQHRHADFVDVLIPDAPQTYRDDVVKLLVDALRRMGNEPVVDAQAEPANDADDDDDDSDDADDGDDASPDQDAKPVKPAKINGARAVRA
jgi:hypothetical protein